MALSVILGINLAHFWNKSGEGLRIKGRLVDGVAGLEAPFEADIEPGIRVLVSPAGMPLAAPALVVADDDEFDLAAWVTEGGGYAGLVGVDGELFGLARNRLEWDLAVAIVLQERGRRLDETERKGTQLFVEDGQVSIRERPNTLQGTSKLTKKAFSLSDSPPGTTFCPSGKLL